MEDKNTILVAHVPLSGTVGGIIRKEVDMTEMRTTLLRDYNNMIDALKSREIPLDSDIGQATIKAFVVNIIELHSDLLAALKAMKNGE